MERRLCMFPIRSSRVIGSCSMNSSRHITPPAPIPTSRVALDFGIGRLFCNEGEPMLKMPPPPKIVRQAFNEGLSNFFVVLRSPVKVLWLQAYILALEEIPDSKGTQNAQLIGWKFFAEDADGKLASGQIATLRNG